MGIILLDMGFGEQCNNDKKLVKKMIDTIFETNNKRHRIILKWQLFNNIKGLLSLDHKVFEYAYEYAAEKNFETTSSVFDIESLQFLLSFEGIGLRQIKIACKVNQYEHRKNLWELLKHIPEYMRIIISIEKEQDKKELIKKYGMNNERDIFLCNIPVYPANCIDYNIRFTDYYLKNGISDHTDNNYLFNRHKPKVYECHVKFPWYKGIDSGNWARTIEQLKEII